MFLKFLSMKLNLKNCRMETLCSKRTSTFIVIIVEREYDIVIAGKYNS